jgi:hypothetical protein
LRSRPPHGAAPFLPRPGLGGKDEGDRLEPSTTSEPGGKEAGQSVTYYIPLARTIGTTRVAGQGEGQQDEIRLFGCGQNAWAKPEIAHICGDCYDDGEGDVCFMPGGAARGRGLAFLSINRNVRLSLTTMRSVTGKIP